MIRSFRTELKYRVYRRHDSSVECAFCDISELKSRQVYLENDDMMIVSNIFPYTRWAGQRVTQHLMIVPKRHILSLNDLHPKERSNMMALIVEYERKGYSFYIRSQADTSRSVGHVHGHLFRFS